jgi:hypothetical protein
VRLGGEIGYECPVVVLRHAARNFEAPCVVDECERGDDVRDGAGNGADP